MDIKEVEKAISKAKIGIMEKPDTTFFSALCCSLKTIIDNSITTACTNGEYIKFNPKFFMELTPEERVFLMAHETLHVAYIHMARREHRDPTIFNAAADFVINLELVNRGFKFIKGGLLDKQYTGLSTEQVYDKLIEDATELPDFNLDVEENNETGTDKVDEAKIQETIIRAALQAEMMNDSESIPESIKRYLSDLKKPKVNWRVLLQRYLTEYTKADYTWAKPNRRYFPHYLPSLQSKQVGRIDFAIDTSGSITQTQFTQFISELHTVLRMFNPKELGVYQFDHALQGSHIVKNIKQLTTLPFMGGGGTQPQCALDAYTENDALVLIVLTDGHFWKHKLKNPNRPVIWAVYDNPNFTAPFGQTLHFSLD